MLMGIKTHLIVILNEHKNHTYCDVACVPQSQNDLAFGYFHLQFYQSDSLKGVLFKWTMTIFHVRPPLTDSTVIIYIYSHMYNVHMFILFHVMPYHFASSGIKLMESKCVSGDVVSLSRVTLIKYMQSNSSFVGYKINHEPWKIYNDSLFLFIFFFNWVHFSFIHFSVPLNRYEHEYKRRKKI